LKALFGIKIWRGFRHLAPVLALGILGIVASVATWHVMSEEEARAAVHEFEGRAENQAIVLRNGIGNYWDELYALQGLFDSSNEAVTREEFETFSKSLLKRHAGILNLSWAPRVSHDERVAHELAGARDGLPDYHIRALGPNGTLPVAPEENEYFPKFYSTDAKTSPVYGLELDDGEDQAQTLSRIRDGDILSITAPLMLHTGKADRRGFWAGLPVYAHGLPHETVEDRRRNLLGIVHGVFQIGVMMDSILADVKSPVRLYLFAANGTAQDLPVYFGSRLGTASIAAQSQSQLAAGLHRSFPVDLGDVRWTMVVTPEVSGTASAVHQTSLIVLICGLLLSSGATCLFWLMGHHARNIEVANKKFEMQNIRFDAALNNMAQGLMMFDPAGKLVITNRRIADLYGMPWEKWAALSLGMTPLQTMQLTHDLTNVGVRNRTQITAELQSILERHVVGRFVFERTNGRTFCASCAPMMDGGFVITFEDITENRRTQELISHMAHHDALTDLPNRVLFYEKMEELLRPGPQRATFAVFSLDLDHFKSVNDRFGHPIGDQLLQAAAGRMRSCVRKLTSSRGWAETSLQSCRWNSASQRT
jgi:CHASE1-domain containing sensor protein